MDEIFHVERVKRNHQVLEQVVQIYEENVVEKVDYHFMYWLYLELWCFGFIRIEIFWI